jgi:DNA-directed RNA polymerase subunit beta'
MWEIIPKPLEFDIINRIMGKKELAALIDAAYRKCTAKETVILADQLKDMGYTQATKAGISIAVGDLTIPNVKERMLGAAQLEVKEIQQQYYDGLITNGERYNKVVDIWDRVSNAVAEAMMEAIENHTAVGEDGTEVVEKSFNSIFIMADSGARGGPAQIKQLAGMRGLMAKPSGEIIETPITANFREGLSVLQYFISTHGARKGLADTALKTANSGYLTRRLVDVA